jgi:O-antigen ligase
MRAVIRAARRLALAIVALLPLTVWPGLERPFSTPKLVLLAAGVVVCAALAGNVARRRVSGGRGSQVLRALVFLWLTPWAVASLCGEFASRDAVVLGVFGALWALVLAGVGAGPRALAAAQVLGTTGVALVTLLQAVGADPFGATGWAPAIAGASSRLALYGTLGNPNFVAALVAGTVPLGAWLAVSAASSRSRWLASAALTLQVLALAATGSRGGALGLAAGALTWLWLTAGRRATALALAGTVVAGVLVAVSPARPLGETVAGRLFIWRVAWPHAWERPVVGRGPGSFAVLYPGWERGSRRPDHPDAADAVFAGPQQHAHNDYLEALVERGLPGLMSLAGVLCATLVAARSAPGNGGAAAGAAGAMALGVLALVDFPFTRPAEVTLFWTAVCAATRGHSEEDT